MDLEQIEKLVEIIEKSTLKEITVEEGNLKINLKRENNAEIQNVPKNIERKTEIVEESDEERNFLFGGFSRNSCIRTCRRHGEKRAASLHRRSNETDERNKLRL